MTGVESVLNSIQGSGENASVSNWMD